jgi:hypothetical protein
VRAAAVGEQVHGVARQVAALDQDPAGAAREDGGRGLAHGRRAVHDDSRDLAHLVEVGCGDGGQRQQPGPQRLDGVRGEQRVPVLGDADRVDDHGHVERGEEFGDGGDEPGRGEHPGLDRLDADVVHDAAELGPHGFRRQFPGALDPQRVLRRDGRDHAHPVDAEGEHGLQVGLDARAAAGVGTGDGEHARWDRHTPNLVAAATRPRSGPSRPPGPRRPRRR